MFPIVNRCALPVLITMLTAGGALAGSLSLSETRVHLDPARPTTLLKVRNAGASKAAVQVSVVEWRQGEDGVDRYEPSSALAVFPKIAEIEASGEQAIRIGYPNALVPGEERTLRLFVEELPVANPGEKAFRFTVKLGVPVFVAGPDARPAPELESAVLRGDSLQLRIRNRGGAHTMVSRITCEGVDAAGAATFTSELRGWYVLAGATRLFRAAISPGACAATRAIRVRAGIEDTRDPSHPSEVKAVFDAGDSGCPVASRSAPRTTP